MAKEAQNGQGIARLIRAAQCSWAGLHAAWQNEAAFRQEALAVIILLPVAFYLGADGKERALLCASLFLVLIVELVNSAIEAVVDRIGPEWHKLSGRAKDLGSAAVACAIVLACLVWLCVLL